MKFLLFGCLGVLVSTLVCPFNFLWAFIITFSSILLLSSIFFVGCGWWDWGFISFFFGSDSVNTPLMVLSCWLLPLTLLASQGHLYYFSCFHQRLYCFLLVFVLVSLVVTFSSLELVLFYISFESTLMPILIMISRWGSQYDRYQAGVYFVFYTLLGSLPFLISIVAVSKLSFSLFLPFFSFKGLFDVFFYKYFSFWWFFTFMVFIVKMPVYGFHLWLPKAHVEATVAGSMLLAAVLLKLGGYGLIRLIKLFSLVKLVGFSSLLFSFCVWGSIITGMICLCQSDLKALIAYSSVGHMSLVAAGMFCGGSSSISGSMVLMVAHGLVSSSLFCLAKFLYERSNTRTVGFMRGYKFLMVLMSVWWLVSCMSNLGLPPMPKFIGELMMVSFLGSLDIILLFVVGGATVVGAVYSLLIYQFTQSGKVVKSFLNVLDMSTREHVLMFLHLFPLFLVVVKPSLICLHF